MHLVHSRSILIFLAIASGVLFVILTSLLYIGYEHLYQINQNIYIQIIESDIPRSDIFWRAITAVGGLVFLTFSTFIVAFYLKKYKKDTIDAQMYLLSMFTGLTIVVLIKLLTAIDRPKYIYAVEETFSFPSGHTALSVIFLTISAYLYTSGKPHKHKILVLLVIIVLSILVAFSRLALGEHWVLDVVGGYLLGISVAFSMILFFHKKTIRGHSQKNNLV